jgi:Tfp pilus assembly protein PilZ
MSTISVMRRGEACRTMARNRRKHPRVRARGVAAHLRTEKGRSPAVVENISAGGIFVRTDRLEPVGTEIFVDLVKPGWKRALTLAAKVTSRVDAIEGRLTGRPPGMGMQFLRVDDKQFARLRVLLRELGAPDPGEGVTLPDEGAEEELRKLDAESTDPINRPPPLPSPWQQVQMVEEAIEGALREANLPPPGPIQLEEEQKPPPPVPPRPLRQEPPPPLPEAPPPGGQPTQADVERLMVQIKGLVLQLSEAQQQIALRDAQIDKMRQELDIIRSALSRAVRKP